MENNLIYPSMDLYSEETIKKIKDRELILLAHTRSGTLLDYLMGEEKDIDLSKGNKKIPIIKVCLLCLKYISEIGIKIDKEPQKFKEIIDIISYNNFLKVVSSETNELRATMFKCLNTMIDNVELFDNDWIIKQLDKLLNQDFQRGKEFYYQEEILFQKIGLLDFKNIEPGINLKAILKGNEAILKEEPISFFWRIDLNKFLVKHKVSLQNRTIRSNLMKMCDYLKEEFKENEKVMYFSFNINKGIYTIALMHIDPQLSSNIEKILNFVSNDSLGSTEYDEKNMNKVILRCNLENSLDIGKITNKLKI